MNTKAQIIRITILTVIASVLLIVNVSEPRTGNLMAPVIRMAIGAAVAVLAARLIGLWRPS